VGCETPAPVLSSNAKNPAQLRRQNRKALLDHRSGAICRSYATAPTPVPRYILKYICLPSGGAIVACPPILDINAKIVNRPDYLVT